MRTRLTRHLAFLGVFVVTLCKPGDTQTLPPAIKDSQDARALYSGHVMQDYLPPGHVVADTQGQGHTQVQGHRERRSTKNNTDFLWPNRVPFVFSTDVEMDRHRLKRVMAYIENHVCVTFHDVTGSYQDTPDWLKQHGYGTSVMLNVVQVSGCTAPLGTSRRRSGILEFQPCNNWYTNLHETGHVLDQIHVQANPDRNLYMSVNPEHVSANQAVLNLQVNKSQFINDFYDTSSVMLYEPTDFSINGLEIYFPIRDELFQHENVFGQERVMFMELSKVYKCNERFCHNISVDCSPGYFTLLKGLCHCVCPEGLDPIRNCKEFRKDADPFIRWPKSPFVLFGPECPKRFQPGTLTLEGTFNPQQSLAPGPPWEFKGHVMNIPFCSRTRGRQSNTDSWPDGNYCAIKPRGVECTRGFEEGSFGWQSDGLLNSTGDIGDINIQGDWLTIRFCCRKTDYQKMPVELPHREPLSLVAYSMGCPEVVGMRMKMTDVTLYSYNTTRSGTHPNSVSWKYGLRFWMCHYTPPTYGCSAESVLDKNTRSATLTTPGYGVAREASRRCFYTFKVPPKSMLLLTFNTYDLHPEDMVLVRRLHMWENPKRLNNDRPPPQILSVFDHLSVEFWTHWDNFTGWGLNFTVELLLPEDSCYDPKTKGEYYKGNKSISEVYEPCLPWAEATSCLDFPFNGTDGIDLLISGENNECRNPRGELLQPWCYTYVNGTVCKKRYCDVCNYLKPYDVLKNCSARVASNPEFCHEATERYGCFNTCLFDLEEYVDPGPVTCGKPRMPHDGNPVGPLKDTYLQGAKVAVSCSAYKGNEANIYLECTDTGWVGPRAACPECMPGWLPFDDTRCLWFSEEKLTRRKAEEQCRSFGHRGTLVEIHSAQDQERVREIRSGKGWKYTHAVWLSGEIKQWDFTGSHEILPFQNFSKADTANMCVRMIAEYYPDRGGWKMVPCDGANKELYICQMEKMGRPPCEDSRYNCEDTLTIYPGWCRDQRSKDNAKIYCAKTCGFCKDPLQCPTPEPADTYSVTSSDLDVHLGDVMTFQCNPDLYHVGGDLQRACGPEGKLLGVEPECASSPKPVDVNKHRVRKRPAGLDKQTGFLLDKKGYRVPFKGKITRWYYMAKNGGELDFVVFRRNARGSQGPPYVYVGSNKVSAEANWIFGFEVPADEQISVQRGDVIGVYSQAKDILYINKCKNKKQKLMNLPVTRAPNFQIIARTRGVFHPRRRECLVPSVGFRVEPT